MENDGTVAYKFLAAALMPVNVILVLGAAALVLAARRRARAAAGAGGGRLPASPRGCDASRLQRDGGLARAPIPAGAPGAFRVRRRDCRSGPVPGSGAPAPALGRAHRELRPAAPRGAALPGRQGA